MPYSLRKLPDEPIVILCVDRALSSREEGIQMGGEIGRALAQCSQHMHLILDFRTLDMSLGVMIMSLAASVIGDGTEGIRLTDPRLHLRVVGTNILAKLWVTAMRQHQFNGRLTLLFESVEEAILDARKEEAEIIQATDLVAEVIA